MESTCNLIKRARWKHFKEHGPSTGCISYADELPWLHWLGEGGSGLQETLESIDGANTVIHMLNGKPHSRAIGGFLDGFSTKCHNYFKST